MASNSPALLLLLSLFASSFFKPSQSAGIAIYWGQRTDEGTLAAACATGNYQIVNIAFLNIFGNGQTPVLNLEGHCDPASTCSGLSSDIGACQNQGVKVFVSLGGVVGTVVGTYSPQEVSDYLWNNFLGGQSSSRPLGSAVLDGIDFDMLSLQNILPVLPLYLAASRSPKRTSGEFWDELAKALAAHRSEKKVYLSAASSCYIPDPNMDAAIKTGLFDYVGVQFYNDEKCEYGANADALLGRWNEWTSEVTSSEIFLGLPAATGGANGGYIPPDVLTSQVLPKIKSSPKYGGVMLWNRFFDQQNGYSDAIKDSV